MTLTILQPLQLPSTHTHTHARTSCSHKLLSEHHAPQESSCLLVNVSAVLPCLFCLSCRRGHIRVRGPFGLLGSSRPWPQQLHVALGQPHHAESKSECCCRPSWLPMSPSLRVCIMDIVLEQFLMHEYALTTGNDLGHFIHLHLLILSRVWFYIAVGKWKCPIRSFTPWYHHNRLTGIICITMYCFCIKYLLFILLFCSSRYLFLP